MRSFMREEAEFLWIMIDTLNCCIEELMEYVKQFFSSNDQETLTWVHIIMLLIEKRCFYMLMEGIFSTFFCFLCSNYKIWRLLLR